MAAAAAQARQFKQRDLLQRAPDRQIDPLPGPAHQAAALDAAMTFAAGTFSQCDRAVQRVQDLRRGDLGSRARQQITAV